MMMPQAQVDRLTQADFVVLGAGGQLGRELMERLPADQTRGLTRAEADLTLPATLSALLQSLRPKVVFNAAAYNLVDAAEEAVDKAFAVNAFGVHRLAQICRDLDAVLVHFSTDYVFGLEGFRPQPYRESDSPGPVNVYGLSKLTGEYFVRQTNPRHFVIRSSGLYGWPGTGGKGGNFVLTMLRLAAAGRPLRVVEDQILTPTSVADLAEATLRLIEASPFGLYHLTNAGQCSWFEFAESIFAQTGIPADLSPCRSADRNDRARRPEYSVLTTEHAGPIPRLRPWQAALADYLKGLQHRGIIP